MKINQVQGAEKSVAMREALEAEAKEKGLTDPVMIAQYVQKKLSQHQQGIFIGSMEFENPDDWKEQS